MDLLVEFKRLLTSHRRLDIHLADNAKNKPFGRVDDVLIMVNHNLVPVDFVVLDIECNASCT